MKFKFKGSLEVRLPEDMEFVAEGESKEEAVEKLLENLVEEGNLAKCLNMDYLKATVISKVFTVRVMETFVNEIRVSTEDYPDLEDEYDVEKFVRNNIEEFDDQIDHSEWELDDREAKCIGCEDVTEEA